MKTITKDIFLKILDGYPLHEIQLLYNLNSLEFSKYLKEIRDNGYMFQRTIISDGSIFLKPNQNLSFKPHQNYMKLVVPSERLKTVFFSDTHIGNAKERLDYIKLAYNYIIEHDIHVVICGGDMIDNVYEDRIPNLINPTLDSQVNKATRVIPDLPGVVNLCLQGNHEAHSIFTEGRDPARMIEDKRYDLISLGYGACKIDMKNDSIGISHFVKKVPIQDHLQNVSITFRGNSHKSKTSYKEDKEIYIPTLSDDFGQGYEYKPLPGFLAAEIIFVDKKIERINTTQFSIVDNELRMSGENAMVLRKVPIEKRKHSNTKGE